MGKVAAAQMLKRDDDDGDEYPYYYSDSWWWSDTGYAVRYALICVILAIILLYFVGGYLHARSRLKKGQPPLAYHRWMVQRSARYERPAHQQSSYPYGPDPYAQGYAMHGYAPPPNPPPAYHGDAPPAYYPPEGASKAMADQNYHAPPRPENQGESSTASQAPRP
ncbi:hypothetical protein BST61_g3188 [Cercospora zeina]